MNKFAWGKIAISAVLLPVIAFVGLFAMIISSLYGGDRFYTPLILIMTIGIIVLLVIGLTGWLKNKTLLIVIGSFVVLAGCAISGYEINKAYHASFATVKDHEIKLFDYQPFTSESKAAKLSEPATFAIRDQLPVLDGATALYPLYAAYAQAVYPEDEYDPYKSIVRSSKTDDAYTDLIHGEADLIFVAGPSKQQIEAAREAGVELKLTPIGREAFVFFVQSDNPVVGVSTEQIRAIYSGEITKWSEVGGKNVAIKAFQRPENSGSQTMLQTIMKDRKLMVPPKEDVAAGMGGIIAQTADYRNYPNALGFSFLFFATEMINNGEIRLLEIDGVAPSRSSISDGTYPLAAEFYAVTAGTTNPHIEDFVQWILSEQGQQLLEQTGYTPLKSSK